MRTFLVCLLAVAGISLATGAPHCTTVNGALGFVFGSISCVAVACALGDRR